MSTPSTDRPTPALAERTIAEALRSFAMTLGCPVAYLERPRVAVVQRLADALPLVRTFTREQVGVISLPSEEEVPLMLDPAEVQELIALTRLERAGGATLSVRRARLVVDQEPAAVSLVDDQTVADEPASDAVLVYEPAADALDQLRVECTLQEWQTHVATDQANQRVGALRGGMLVALATAEAAEGRLSRIRVLVSPHFRGEGLGALVMHTLVRQILRQGLLPYVRLAANDLQARALATTVGFVAFARGLTLQVTIAQPQFA